MEKWEIMRECPVFGLFGEKSRFFREFTHGCSIFTEDTEGKNG